MKHQIPYSTQCITDEDIQAVVDVLKSPYLTQGPQVDAFEEIIAKKVNAKYAVALNNGTTALHLANAILLQNTPKHKKVITTPITFVASANATLYCGNTVEFVDIDPNTFLIDFNQIEDKLKQNPNSYAGITAVSFAGLPIDTKELKKIANKYNVWILEDASHAPGAYINYENEKVFSASCNYTDMATCSFHPVKHIACGEGGIVTTNNEKHYKQLKKLRTHGITKNSYEFVNNVTDEAWYHEMQDLGFNYRISDILCALGISQTKKLEESIAKRHILVQKYKQELNKINEIVFQKVPANAYHAYHLLVIRTDKRKALFNYLKQLNINCQVHYIPAHLMPYYQNLGCKIGTLQNAEQYYKECLSIPLYPHMTTDQQDYVIEKIKAFYEQ